MPDGPADLPLKLLGSETEQGMVKHAADEASGEQSLACSVKWPQGSMPLHTCNWKLSAVTHCVTRFTLLTELQQLCLNWLLRRLHVTTHRE